jgi:hypothetical protein
MQAVAALFLKEGHLGQV